MGPAAAHQWVVADSGQVLVAQLRIADTFWLRFKGLQLRGPLEPGEGLLLTPCRSIHTHWMRFAIDAALLDQDGLVLRKLSAVPPWRIPPRVAGVRAVVETVAGGLAELDEGVSTRVVGRSGE